MEKKDHAVKDHPLLAPAERAATLAVMQALMGGLMAAFPEYISVSAQVKYANSRKHGLCRCGVVEFTLTAEDWFCFLVEERDHFWHELTPRCAALDADDADNYFSDILSVTATHVNNVVDYVSEVQQAHGHAPLP